MRSRFNQFAGLPPNMLGGSQKLAEVWRKCLEVIETPSINIPPTFRQFRHGRLTANSATPFRGGGRLAEVWRLTETEEKMKEMNKGERLPAYPRTRALEPAGREPYPGVAQSIEALRRAPSVRGGASPRGVSSCKGLRARVGG